MPSLEEHCKRTLKRYGVEGRDIHQWLDEPSRKYAGVHRQFRHDTETIRLVGEIFGKKYGKSLAENIALDHIMLDHAQEIKKRTTIVVKFPGQKDIPTVPCSYCDTLLKPSDQFCPKCGASRTKIIKEIDRAYEMEKRKLQEKRKKLRKELKRELFFRELTLEERVSLWKNRRLTRKSDAILEELVQKDFEKHPELEQQVLREIAAEERKSNVIGLLIVSWCIIPAVYIGIVLHWMGGVIWFFGWGFSLFTVRILMTQAKEAFEEAKEQDLRQAHTGG